MTIQIHAMQLPVTKKRRFRRGFKYVIFNDNQVVGFANVEVTAPRKYLIDSIKVNEGSRGVKLGSALMQRIIDDADKEGMDIELYATDPDVELLARKIAWYKRFGFVEQHLMGHISMTGTWMFRPATKHRVAARRLIKIDLSEKEKAVIANQPQQNGITFFSDAHIKRIAKRVKKEFVFTGSENTMEYLNDLRVLSIKSEPFDALNTWQQRYLLSQAIDPNVESCHDIKEAHQEVAEYTYTFTTIPLNSFPVSYWERLAGKLVLRVEENTFDPETRYLAVQIQRVFDLQLKIEKEGFDRKQPIVVLGIASDPTPRFAVDNGHHRLQALRNLTKAGKVRATMRVPVVIRFRKDIHGYGHKVYKDITDVHHLLPSILGDSHWPDTAVPIPFTFGRGTAQKILTTYMKRIDAGRVLIETAMPLTREPKIALLRDAIAYIRKLRPGIQVVSRSRYPGDKNVLKKLESDGVLDCVLGETCEEDR